jgi:glycosyltransferase involved in cell wall biosynthesis
MLLHRTSINDARVRREASALAKAGCEVCILELASVDEHVDVGEGVRRISVLPPDWLRSRAPTIAYRTAFLAAFTPAIRRLRPQVVHAHDAATLLPGLLGARLTGARLVYDSHELASGVQYRSGAWAAFVNGIERLGATRADAVITVSDEIADRLESRYRLPSRPCVIRNVCALRRPNGSRPGGLRAAAGVSDAPLILHQGAAAPGRGCETLLRAIARLDDSVRLVFLGSVEPGYGPHLDALVDQLDLSARVHRLPNAPLDELLTWTREADVGVSLLEPTCENYRLTIPNKLFEYVASEVPVVASAGSAAGSLVRERALGWTADSDDPESVANALRAAIAARGDTALLDRLHAADATFRWEAEQTRLTDLYRRLSPVPGVQRP